MKVLLLANINSAHSKKWALGLKQRGLQVGIFSINAKAGDDSWFLELDFVYYPEFNRKNLFKKYRVLHKALKSSLVLFKPDIINSHFATHYSFLANLSGFKPHVISTWGSDVFEFPRKNFLFSNLLKYNFKRADALISTSKIMAKEISLYTNKEVSVIPFGINFSLFKYAAQKKIDVSKTIRIGCFKHLKPIYGIDILIKAFYLTTKKMPHLNFELNIAGEGSQLVALKNLVKEFGIEKNVNFLGWVEVERVPELLSGMDICIYVSRHESFGVSLLEAMASGVPIIASKTVGFIEVVETQDNALLVPVEDPEQTALAIEKLVNDSLLYESIRINAYRHSKSSYNLELNLQEQIKVYEKIISENKPAKSN